MNPPPMIAPLGAVSGCGRRGKKLSRSDPLPAGSSHRTPRATAARIRIFPRVWLIDVNRRSTTTPRPLAAATHDVEHRGPSRDVRDEPGDLAHRHDDHVPLPVRD